MRAIILAAGIGRRLKEVSNNLPKPLFEINNKSLLFYSLEAIYGSGIKDVIIIVGYKKEIIRNRIGNNFKGMNITYVENHIYENTGSMHSLSLALKQPQDCLVLDGDLVFNSAIIPQLLEYTEKNAGIIIPCTGNGDEVLTVIDQDKKITYLGKQHPGYDVSYEFTGISKFSKAFFEAMINQYKMKGDMEEQYEIGPYRTSKAIPWYGFTVGRGLWSEIDSKDDIKRAEQVIDKYWHFQSGEKRKKGSIRYSQYKSARNIMPAIVAEEHQAGGFGNLIAK